MNPRPLFGNVNVLGGEVKTSSPDSVMVVPQPLFGDAVGKIALMEAQRGQAFSPRNLFADRKPLTQEDVIKIIEKKFTPKATSLFGGHGTVRKRLEIKPEDLLKYKDDAAICKNAHYLIISTNIDILTIQDVLKYGEVEQQEHGAMLQHLMEISQDQKFQEAKGLFNEIVNDLGAAKPENLLSTGLLDRIKGLDKEEKVKNHFKLIDKKIGRLNFLLPVLENQLVSVKEIEKDIKQLEVKMAPQVVYCGFFTDYKEHNGQPFEFTELYLGRLSSLMTTEATLKQNKIQVDLLYRSIYNLIDAIKNILNVEINLWKTNYINMLTNNAISGNLNSETDSLIEKIKKLV